MQCDAMRWDAMRYDTIPCDTMPPPDQTRLQWVETTQHQLYSLLRIVAGSFLGVWGALLLMIRRGHGGRAAAPHSCQLYQCMILFIFSGVESPAAKMVRSSFGLSYLCAATCIYCTASYYVILYHTIWCAIYHDSCTTYYILYTMYCRLYTIVSRLYTI